MHGRKSQIAIQFCHYIRDESPQTWIFWVHASTKARLEEAYRGIADRLDLPGRNEPTSNVFQLVYNWLCNEKNGRWVLALDNVDDAEVFFPKLSGGGDTHGNIPTPLASYLPQCSHGFILITSRNKDAATKLASGENVREVAVMNHDQALQLFETKLQDASTQDGASDLVRALEHIPLAITQAAAYIHKHGRMTVKDYLEKFLQNNKKRENLLSRDMGDLRRDGSVSNSVVTTWQMSFERVRSARPSAADLLSLMSHFHPQGIPEWVLRRWSWALSNDEIDATSDNDSDDTESSSDSEGGIEFDDDIEMLQDFSLVARTLDNMFEMHALIQFCTRLWTSSSSNHVDWQEIFLTLVLNRFPDGEEYKNWTKCQQLMPHLESILNNAQVASQPKMWQCRLVNVAGYLWRRGSYSTAENIARRAFVACQEVFGYINSSGLRCMDLLAVILDDRGKYEEAEELHRRALRWREEELGPRHASTLKSVDRLALVLASRARYEEAEEMHRRALKGREMQLGRQHSDTLGSANNLGLILCDQGKYDQAEEMYRQALKGYEKRLGLQHPHTLKSVNNLAVVLYNRGKYEEAEEMHRRVLAGYEKELGPLHPSTLGSVDNLAMALRGQGKLQEAEEMHRRALEGYEEGLGPQHPSTLGSVNNLALALRSQGRHREAEEMHRRALDGYEKDLGPQHPHTLRSAENLALALRGQGKLQEAEEMLRRALKGKEDVLGPEHPTTLGSINNLALVLNSRGKYEEAEHMHRRALKGKEKALGMQHSSTLKSVNNLVSVLRTQGKHQEADEMHRRALEGSSAASELVDEC